MRAIFIAPPFVDQLQRDEVEIELPGASGSLADHQSGFFQDGEMVHDRDAADVERFGELANALIELVAQRYYAARGTDTQPRLTVISNKD